MRLLKIDNDGSVNLDKILFVKRRDNQTELTLRNGSAITVKRSYESVIREIEKEEK
jgi:hypothetical protein